MLCICAPELTLNDFCENVRKPRFYPLNYGDFFKRTEARLTGYECLGNGLCSLSSHPEFCFDCGKLCFKIGVMRCGFRRIRGAVVAVTVWSTISFANARGSEFTNTRSQSGRYQCQIRDDPIQARRRYAQGEGLFKVRVNVRTGRVKEVTVMNSTGDGLRTMPPSPDSVTGVINRENFRNQTLLAEIQRSLRGPGSFIQSSGHLRNESTPPSDWFVCGAPAALEFLGLFFGLNSVRACAKAESHHCGSDVFFFFFTMFTSLPSMKPS